jgi:tetratricopeptide (TPR) repeat protein
METQAIRSGRRPPDQALVDRIFASAMLDAASEEDAGRRHLALRRYELIAAQFSGLHDVSAAEQKAAALRQVREVKEALGALDQSVGVQEAYWDRARRLIVAALAGDDKFAGTQDLSRQLHDLQYAAASGRAAERMAARRVLASSRIWFSDRAADDMQRGEFERAAAAYRFVALIRPDRASAEYNLARACARAGNRKEAIAALRRAVAKGFADAAVLQTDEALASLRNEDAFREIMAALEKN